MIFGISLGLVLGIPLYLRYGSVTAALAAVEGRSVLVARHGDGRLQVRAGETARLRFTVRNLLSRPVKVFGAKTTCGCAVVEKLPLILEPRQEQELELAVSTSAFNAGSEYLHEAALFTDPPDATAIVRMALRVLE